MKFLPIVIGKLYRYSSYSDKVIYSNYPSEQINMIIGQITDNDLFVPLEEEDCDLGVSIPSKLFKILTTSGMIGWVYMYYSEVMEVEG